MTPYWNRLVAEDEDTKTDVHDTPTTLTTKHFHFALT
jgi:hypothetical protein